MVRRWLLALALVGCSAPAPLPSLPSTMPSLLGPVPVEQVAQVGDDSTTLADVRFMQRRIRIRRDLAPAAAWQAYFHEGCHLWLYDEHAQLGGDEEERTCDVWANARFQELVTRR